MPFKCTTQKNTYLTIERKAKMNLDITDFSVLKISQDKEGIRIPLSTQGKLKFQNMFKQESDVRINILVKKNKHFI